MTKPRTLDQRGERLDGILALKDLDDLLLQFVRAFVHFASSLSARHPSAWAAQEDCGQAKGDAPALERSTVSTPVMTFHINVQRKQYQ
jgi:hypothetical protein